MTQDEELLDQFVRQGSRPALDELIRRHLGLVYTSALRQVGDRHLAEDVTQAVFLVLSKKAHSIRSGAAIAGWLLSVTHRASVSAMKKQARQRKLDRLGARQEMEIDGPAAARGGDGPWEDIAPLLDAELHRLGAKDRDAVVLRFFQDRTFAQVGEQLGLSEEAARKRVTRALERLRGRMARRGVSVSAVALGVAMTGRVAQAAPPHLLGAAIASVAAASAATATIAAATINMIGWAKAQLIAMLAGACVLAGAIFVAGAMAAQMKAEPETPQSVLPAASPTQGGALSQLVGAFETEYPAAEAKLEEAYSHVRIMASVARWDGQGKYFLTEQTEMLREGRLYQRQRTVVDSAQAAAPVGSFSADGGDRHYFFELHKNPGDAKFSFDWSGPKIDVETAVHLQCQPFFAPYFVLQTSLADYLKQSARRIVSAEAATLDGVDVVELDVDGHVGGQVYHDRFYFMPHTWALAGWTLDESNPYSPRSVWEERNQYEAGSDPPKLIKAENWIDDKKLGVQRQKWTFDIGSVTFGPIPASEFTMAAVGVK